MMKFGKARQIFCQSDDQTRPVVLIAQVAQALTVSLVGNRIILKWVILENFTFKENRIAFTLYFIGKAVQAFFLHT